MDTVSERDRRAAEEIETRALVEMHEAGPEELHALLEMGLARVGEAVVATSRREPGTLFNRAIGLGLEGPVSHEDVDAVLGHFNREGIGNYYLHILPEVRPAGVRDWLRERGLRPGRRWVKFLRGPDPAPEERTDLEVVEIDETHALDFGRIVAEGFGLCREAAFVLAAVVGRPSWRVFLSFDGGSPAGGGLLYAHEGVGWFSYAATRPAFRGRGSQGALLARRIETALDLGCRLLVTETGEEVEGEPQHSYRNIERAGFRAAYARENWVPAAPNPQYS